MYDSDSTSDNLGLNQTRVLDSAGRSFESVVYQRRKPPLSCEVNLTSRLAADHAQEAFTGNSPSGWEVTGLIRDGLSESLAMAGDVVCSPNYADNSFKLIANDKGAETGRLAAWVAGHRLIIQGTNNLTDLNNNIILGEPSNNRVDFVFLEVWRKLVSVTDPVYKYGNTQGNTFGCNDLIDPAIGIETTLRIQVQYRIRVAEIDVNSSPEGFNPYVFVQGPQMEPITSPTPNPMYNFNRDPGDPGLWVAGLGDSASQEQLGTVDGYVYAIPMFLVARRNPNSYSPNVYVNGSSKTRADYLAGVASDRPDGKFNNWIVADDILDMRHRITPVENAKELCEKAFLQLIKGKLPGKMSRDTRGEDHYGVTLTQIDGVTLDDPGYFKKIGIPDGLKRVFCKAEVLQPNTIDPRPPVGQWMVGDLLTITPPAGTTIESLDSVTVNGDNGVNTVFNEYLMAAGVKDLGSSNIYIMVSRDKGATWTVSYASSFIYNGDSFVAACQGPGVILASIQHQSGDGSLIYSLDGLNWESALDTVGTYFKDIVWSTNMAVAVGTGGVVGYSTDGINWSTTTVSGGDPTMNAVVWGDGKFVAVGKDAYISTDGINWVHHPIPWDLHVSDFLNGLVDIIWDGVQFLSVVDGVVATSPDGYTWTEVFSTGDPLWSIAWVGPAGSKIYVAGGENQRIVRSLDGVNWVDITDTPASGITLYNVVWTGNKFLFVGGNSSSSNSGIGMTSVDGVSWDSTTYKDDSDNQLNDLFALTTGGYHLTDSSTKVWIDMPVIPNTITLDYTLRYAAGSGSAPGENGFSQLPTQMLEVRKEDSTIAIATMDQDVRIRDMAGIVFGQDSTSYNMVSNRGAYADQWDFGHQMIYHAKGNATNTLQFNKNQAGYNILGVASIHDGLTYRNISSLNRIGDVYTVISDATFAFNADITMGLYTDNKFFEINKQGRGITNSYQMIEVQADQTGDGLRTAFTIYTGNRRILALGSNATYDGFGVAYVNDVQKVLDTNNTEFPSANKNTAIVRFSLGDTPANGTYIKVPILTEGPLDSEGYLFFYKTLPYQGYMDAPITGALHAEGLAITTSAGCGGVTNQNWDVYPNYPFFTEGSKIIGVGDPADGNWLASIKPGNTIASDMSTTQLYIVESVVNDSTLILASPARYTYASSYTNILIGDKANFSQPNIIDRMPSYSGDDWSGNSTYFEVAASVTEAVHQLTVVARTQDILDAEEDKVQIGVNSAARGRSKVDVGGDKGYGTLGLRYSQILDPDPYPYPYHKTYQSYLINKDSSGELYLMVVGSESVEANTTHNNMLYYNSTKDTVDIFRIPGRPLAIRKAL